MWRSKSSVLWIFSLGPKNTFWVRSRTRRYECNHADTYKISVWQLRGSEANSIKPRVSVTGHVTPFNGFWFRQTYSNWLVLVQQRATFRNRCGGRKRPKSLTRCGIGSGFNRKVWECQANALAHDTRRPSAVRTKKSDVSHGKNNKRRILSGEYICVAPGKRDYLLLCYLYISNIHRIVHAL